MIGTTGRQLFTIFFFCLGGFFKIGFIVAAVAESALSLFM